MFRYSKRMRSHADTVGPCSVSKAVSNFNGTYLTELKKNYGIYVFAVDFQIRVTIKSQKSENYINEFDGFDDFFNSSVFYFFFGM